MRDGGPSPWTVSLGPLAERVEAAIEALEASDFLSRLLARDARVFTPEPLPELDDRLGWVDLPARMVPEVARWRDLAHAAHAAGIERSLVLGMGGSSLAPEVFARTLGVGESGVPVAVLDTTHPDAIRRVAAEHPPETTLYVVSSKSGTTIETASLLEHFWAMAADRLPEPGRRFVAVTDPGTALERIARERSFLAVEPGDPEVGGRFSALSPFGLLPASLLGADVAELLAAAARRLASSPREALRLGAILGEAALAGRDKLTIVTDRALSSFPLWLEQLVAESTGKRGRGLVPVVGEPERDPTDYGNDRLFVFLESGAGGTLGGRARALAEAGHPVVAIPVETPHGIGGQMMLWEVATAVAGAILGVNPFDQPDVEAAKVRAREALAASDEPGTGADVVDVGGLAEAAATTSEWLAGAAGVDHVALQAFVDPTDRAEGLGYRLRERLSDVAAATTLGFGPRFLHSTGQLHKGGPGAIRCVQWVDRIREDLEIPGGPGTFGELLRAQAAGDARALADRGRSVLRMRWA